MSSAVPGAESAPEAEPRTQERTYVLTVSVAHALVHATELTFAALLLRIEADFGTDLLLLGVLANVGAFAFGLGALPSGMLVDRLGTIPILRLALGASAVTSALVALSGDEIMLGVSLALMGLATGLYHPAGITMLARTKRRARNVGLHGAIGNFGIALAPALAAGLAVTVDWRAAYVVLAVLAGIVFLVSMRLDVRGPEPDLAELPDSSPDAKPTDASLDEKPSGETNGGSQWRVLLLVYGAFVISGFIYRGSLTFIPAPIEEEVSIALFGWEAAAVAGALSTLALLGGAIGWYSGGLVSERFRKDYFVLALSPIVALLLLLTSFATDAGLLVVIFFFVIVNFAMQPAFVTLVADYSPPGRLGTSFGISFFLSFGMGSFAASFAGFFADRWGTDSVFAMLAAVALLGTLLTVALVAVSRRRLGSVAAVP